jgi:hypothetical protein
LFCTELEVGLEIFFRTYAARTVMSKVVANGGIADAGDTHDIPAVSPMAMLLVPKTMNKLLFQRSTPNFNYGSAISLVALLNTNRGPDAVLLRSFPTACDQSHFCGHIRLSRSVRRVTFLMFVRLNR